MNTRGKYFRFYKERWKKATCGICWCLVHRYHMQQHALVHWEAGLGDECGRPGTNVPFTDLYISGPNMISGGHWQTASRGPM